MSAELGKGNKAVNFVLHKTRDQNQSLLGGISGDNLTPIPIVFICDEKTPAPGPVGS